MKTRAAVAWEAGKPLEVMEIDLEGPKEGEVLIRNVATGVCHTDAFTLSGEDPEGIFPSVLGHEGGAVVEEIGQFLRQLLHLRVPVRMGKFLQGLLRKG